MKDINWSANSTLCIVCIHAHAYLCAKCKSEICINLEIKLYLFWNLCSLNNNWIFMKLKRTALQFRDHIQSCKPVREVNLLQVAPNLNTFKILLYAYSYLHNTCLLIISTTEKKQTWAKQIGFLFRRDIEIFFSWFY